MNKPIVGITMGDPAGSGPEITIKALADPEQYTYCLLYTSDAADE